MSLRCPRCHHILEFSGDPPSFCAYCGHALAPTVAPPAVPVSEAATLPPSAPAPGEAGSVGDVVGGYRLLRRLGEGGMGAVYEAEEIVGGRRVALKLISEEYADSPDAVERFRQEGRLASAISHPRCVFVLAADEDAGRPYIVMELMPGPNLQDVLDRDGPLPVGQAVARILDVLDGLREAHRLGVIHRDVKPSNCFLDADGRVKVGDFGLSKSLAQNAPMTRSGAFLGTLLYAAPEQVRGERADRQSDLYAAAATLYTLLAGRAPHQTGDAAATLARVVADDAPPLRPARPDVPAALERVILRGLERDRARRWPDLEEFRQALLPFAPGAALYPNPAARFAAALIDQILANVLAIATWLLYVFATAADAASLSDPAALTRPEGRLFGELATLLYFLLFEAVGDASLGKKALGLRVRRASGGDVTGFGRGAARAAVFVGVLAAGSMADALVPWAADYSLLFYCLGVALLICPMRARNGYRGLHEFLSGTRVVSLPPPPETWPVQPRLLERHVAREEAVPVRIGPFEVRGALARHGTQSVLLGEDRALGRPVILWLRPRGEAPLPPARRDVARAARLRWLAGGEEGDERWDAFPAPTGCPLSDWVEGAGPRPWREARTVLEQLTEELAAARDDDTLPECLATEQVWVDAGGQVRLMDVPLSPVRTETKGEAAGDGRALDLVRVTAVLTLEGRPRRPRDAGETVRAPLPSHARPLLDRLIGKEKSYKKLASWRKDLGEIRDRPSEVNRARRTVQLAVLAALTLAGLFCMLAGGTTTPTEAAETWGAVQRGERVRAGLERRAVWQLAVAALSPAPAARLGALAQFDADLRAAERLDEALARERALYDAQTRSLGWVGRVLKGVVVQGIQADLLAEGEQGPDGGFRREADRRTQRRVRPYEEDARFATYFLWSVPAIWLVWNFFWRGGLNFRLSGLALVGLDGRPAARWRCAWRTLLVWTPFAALLTASLWLEVEYWQGWEAGAARAGLALLSWALWWLGLALLPTYAALALRRPARGPLDWLAGTVLVPR